MLSKGWNMKIIGIVASPRGARGNTARLLKLLLEGARAQGAESETIILRGDSVLPCKACNTCHKKGICPQKDDFNRILDKIDKADGLILASPNYIFSVSAQMKAFLDRCCGVIHRLGFEGKYGASVVTSGGGDEPQIAKYMNHFLMTTGVMPVGAIWATMGGIEGNEFPDSIRKKAHALGKKLVTQWENKKTTAEFEKTTAQFRERMRYLMIRRKDEWPFEYEYWKKNRGSFLSI